MHMAIVQPHAGRRPVRANQAKIIELAVVRGDYRTLIEAQRNYDSKLEDENKTSNGEMFGAGMCPVLVSSC